MKTIAIGVDDFKKLRDQGSYFVDKSLFIERIIEDPSEVLLFPRPRRFGKTLNMSMLRYFFNIENSGENRKLFDGLAITKTQHFNSHQGKYPVIFVSLKDIKSGSADGFLSKVKMLITTLFNDHKYLLEGNRNEPSDMELFRQISAGNAELSLYEGALKLISRMMAKHYDQKTIILMDEYDTPVHEAWLNGFYDTVVKFLRLFLGNALKGNEYLQKGILTGILRVSKESMFSDLNNVMVFSVLNQKFNQSFGFNQQEVNQILADYQLMNQQKMVKDWYNGYYFGDEEIYNPWSILCFIRNQGEFRPYWLSTSANDLVHQLIKDSGNEVKKDIEDALNNKPVECPIEESIAFQNLQATRENIISFFVQTGYLKARFKSMENSRMNYEISIPNEELKIIYTDTINLWFQESIGSSNMKEMLKALIAGDIELFEEILSSFVLSYLSYYHTPKDHIEKVYHAFVLGMLINLQESYHIESEREAGYGRVDIIMTPKDRLKPGIILEMKKIRTSENAQTAIASALAQIENRQYETLLRQQGCQNIMKLAVTFDGKRVWARKG
jgi:hypothetical protein